MLYKRKLEPAGFTIVETMFVLAIAGIIVMLVFLAEPALERSSRNDQRKQDVAYILQAVSHYELSNSGNMPPDTSFIQPDKLTSYAVSNVAINTTILGATTPATTTNNLDADHVAIYNHAKCDTTSLGSATDAGAGYNDVVALFAVESGSTAYTPQCEQL